MPAFPFEDHVAYTGDLEQVIDAVVVLRDGLAVLSQLDIGLGTMQCIDRNTSDVIADSANDAITVTQYGAYDVVELNDTVNGTLVRLTVPHGVNVSFTGAAPFVIGVHQYWDDDIKSVNSQVGDVVIALDATMTFDPATGILEVKDPAQRIGDPAACSVVYSVNGVYPDNNGVLGLSHSSCYKVYPDGSQIVISNICSPCCQCEDYYTTYMRLYGYDAALSEATSKVLQDDSPALSLARRYNELVNRFQRYLQTPRVTDRSGGASSAVASAYGGADTETQGLFVLARMTPGAYGAMLAVSVTNGFDASADITISAKTNYRVRISERGRVQCPIAMNGDIDFPNDGSGNPGGFPGSVTISGVPSKSALVARGECFEPTLPEATQRTTPYPAPYASQLYGPLSYYITVTAVRAGEDDVVVNLAVSGVVTGPVNLGSNSTAPTTAG